MAAPVKRATQPEPSGVNFGDLNMYVAGGGLPEGDYCIFFNVKMHDGFGVVKNAPRLGVMADCYPLSDPTPEAMKQVFWSMGSGADKSFAPNPETGKGLVPIPGGPGTTLVASTNWALVIHSLYDSGLPQGIFSDDISILDGVWAHMINIPEPEERKGFQSKTAEGAPEQRQSRTIPVFSAILDGGAPWEGGGGLPDKKKAGAKPTPKTAPAKAAPAAKAPAKAAESTDDDVQTTAISAVSNWFEKNPDGGPKLGMKTSTFKYVSKAVNEDMASAVIDTYFADEDALNTLIGPLGYIIAGPMVKVAV